MDSKKVIIIIITVIFALASLLFSACDDAFSKDAADVSGTSDADSDEKHDSETTEDENDYFEDDYDEGSLMNVQFVVGDKIFDADLYNVDASKELYSMLPLTIDMSDMPHEKYYYLDRHLTSNPGKVGFIEEGDVMLWGSNCLVLFYESFSSNYSYTKLGKMQSSQGLSEALGKGKVTVTVRRA